MNRIAQVNLAVAGLMLYALIVPDASGIQSRIVELHPTPENIPEVADPRFILRADRESTFIDEASYERITIGVEDGELHEMFGEVVDLALPGDGTVLVLDRRNSEVRVFDYGGALLTTFGGPGNGPGEFQKRPYKISSGDQGRAAFALDEFGESVTAFGRLDPSTFTPKMIFRTGLLAHNGCAMNGHYWVYGYNPAFDGVLHKFTYGGERVASFLEYYQSPRELVTHLMSRNGLLACSEAHGIVAMSRFNAPVVTGYLENGEVAWRVKIADFDQVRWAESAGQPWGYDRPKPGQSQLRSLFADQAGNFFVQFVTFEEPGFENIPDYGPLFKIDARTGKGTYLGIAPSVVRGIDSGYVFSTSNKPFPRVVIHKPTAGAN